MENKMIDGNKPKFDHALRHLKTVNAPSIFCVQLVRRDKILDDDNIWYAFAAASNRYDFESYTNKVVAFWRVKQFKQKQ